VKLEFATGLGFTMITYTPESAPVVEARTRKRIGMIIGREIGIDLSGRTRYYDWARAKGGGMIE
jgi:hypothetical protein